MAFEEWNKLNFKYGLGTQSRKVSERIFLCNVCNDAGFKKKVISISFSVEKMTSFVSCDDAFQCTIMYAICSIIHVFNIALNCKKLLMIILNFIFNKNTNSLYTCTYITYFIYVIHISFIENLIHLVSMQDMCRWENIRSRIISQNCQL